MEYRSIQLGLRGTAVQKYVNDWIVSIEDITEYVMKLREQKSRGMDINSLLPTERIYSVNHLGKEMLD